MFKISRKTFAKLYRYYCAKLLTKIGTALFYFLLALVLVGLNVYTGRKWIEKFINSAVSGQQKLLLFFLISGAQGLVLSMVIAPFISYLTGRGLGWRQLQRKQLFSIPKISREEDVKVILFTPDINRETMILAKFAAVFTYFMVINFFLLALPMAIYFLAATKLGTTTILLFLLLNGIGFALVSFCLIVPFLFYQQEGGSFGVYLFCIMFSLLLSLSLYLLRETISQHPTIFSLLALPFAVLTGCLFFWLYGKRFLKSDLD